MSSGIRSRWQLTKFRAQTQDGKGMGSGSHRKEKPPESPGVFDNLEREKGSECLDHFVIFGERHLRHLLRELVAHYHSEPLGAVRCRSRLGGQLNFYLRQAA